MNQLHLQLHPLGQVLSIVVVGESATKILDINNFVADGSTNTFVTNVTWVDNATHFVNIQWRITFNIV